MYTPSAKDFIKTSHIMMRNIHLQSLPERKELFQSIYTTPQFWLEVGAYIITLPRQSGKTYILEELLTMDTCLIRHTDRNVFTKLVGTDYRNKDLLIDNYELFDTDELTAILSFDWKSVTMTASGRL